MSRATSIMTEDSPSSLHERAEGANEHFAILRNIMTTNEANRTAAIAAKPKQAEIKRAATQAALTSSTVSSSGTTNSGSGGASKGAVTAPKPSSDASRVTSLTTGGTSTTTVAAKVAVPPLATSASHSRMPSTH
jgi:hypothetical protein